MSFNKLILFLPLLLVSCGSKPEAARDLLTTVHTRVTVFTVAASSWPGSFEASGTVRARTSAAISSRIMAHVREVNVRAGDSVRSGQSLITLDSRELDTALAQARAAVEEARSGRGEADSGVAAAQAQLDLARTTLGRMQELLDKRSISRQEFDEAAARVKVAEAGVTMAGSRRRQLDEKIHQAEQALQSAQVMKAYTDIAAPFAGVVTARKAEPGILAAPGMVLLEIEQSGAFRLEAAIDESRLSTIRQGTSAEVHLDALSAPLQGRVTEIVPAIDAASRSFTAKIDLPAHPSLRSGLFGRALFSIGERSVAAVPQSAIRSQGQLQFVMIAEEGHARSRMVSTGAARDGNVEILSGLRAGDRVISTPAEITDGARIEVTP